MTARKSMFGARQWTLTLAGVLTSAAVLIGLQAGSGPIVALGLPDALVIGVLVALFFLTEHLVFSVEFRRQAHTLTLAGVPLALAVLLAPAHTAILTRVVGALIALLLQRISWDKVLYNIAAYAFEIAVSSALAGSIIGSDPQLNAGTFAVVLAVIVVVDQVMSGLVLWVISLHNGRIGRRDVVPVLANSFALSLITTAFATAIVLLVDFAGFLGIELVVVVAVVGSLAYRGYASTRRRHQSLELIHSFVAVGVGAESVTALTEQLLARIRTLMNAGTAELRLFEPGHPPRRPPAPADISNEAAEIAVLMAVSDESGLQIIRQDVDPTDWLTLRVRTENEPALLVRNTKDRAVRSWLGARGFRDAVIIPLPPSQDTAGLVIVSDRLGETATFTADDVTLLQTLTGHLAVALRSTRLVEKLSYDASHDSLTGLHNRAHLADCIHRALAQRGTEVTDIAVLLLDLDGFKEVNDNLGHDAGDRLLQIVGRRLVSNAPTGATVARLGGDEFAVLLPNVRSGGNLALDIAKQIADSLSQPVELDEARLDIQASIGVAVSSGANPAGDLLRQADTAMYTAKTARIPISLYSVAMDRVRTESLELLSDLRAALRDHPEQFVLYYQPKIDLRTQGCVGTEALVRWQHPRLGFIGPDVFIPLAEATGLIEVLTPLVLNAALAECAEWNARGHHVGVAVNLSTRNIENPELPALVARALRTYGVDPAQLILEITESSVMGEPEQTLPVLNQLNDLGLSLSLDDFGTGHSSLSYLQQLPVTEVKIDRSFVVGLNSSQPGNSRALIRSIASLSKNLGLRVVAEGVEDDTRLVELSELGCDIAQGYEISRPLPALEIRAWLDNRERARPKLRLLTHGV